MVSPRASADSPDEELHGHERILQQFDQVRRSTATARIEDYLPLLASGAVDPTRRQLLEELVRIDLECSWRQAAQGSGARLEDYVKRFPELGPAGGLPLELIGWEYRVRQRWGKQPTHEDYATRFPRHGSELSRTLARIDAELAAEFGQRARRVDEGRPTAALPASKPVPGSTGVPPMRQPIASIASLIDMIRRLQLLPPEHVNELNSEPGRFAEPRALARELLQRSWLTPYQVNQLLQGNGDDLILGPYIMQERLGEGGAGQVFKARHVKMGRVVALKLIHKELLQDVEVVGRFQREIRVVGQLSHPNIVHAFDAGPVGSSYFLAMEYIEGTDLDRLVRRAGPLPVAQAVGYLRQAALGLQHAHEKGLVHRDIKPSNLLLVSHTSAIKVADLGLARFQRVENAEATAHFTAAIATQVLTPIGAVMMGTPDYLAPEQALDFHAADIRADIYSLGCTLFFLLTGRAPFAGGMLAQKLLLHQSALPPDIAQVRPDVPAALVAAFQTMMAKRPQDRYQTPGDLAAALASIAAALPPATSGPVVRVVAAAGPPRPAPFAIVVAQGPDVPVQAIPLAPTGSAPARTWSWPVRRWPTWVRRGAASAVLALVVLLAIAVWPKGPPPPLPSPEATTVGADLERVNSRLKEYNRSDPKGVRDYLLAVRQIQDGRPAALRAIELLMSLPSPLDSLFRDPVRPDDRRSAEEPEGLVKIFGDARLRHWGKPLRILVSPDGGLIATTGIGGIRLWDAASGEPREQLAESWGQEIQFGPIETGGQILAVLDSSRGTLRRWNCRTATEMPVLQGVLGFSPDLKLAAIRGKDGQPVRLYSLAKGEEEAALSGDKFNLRRILFSADAKVAASVEALSVLVWETAAGKLLATLKGPKRDIVEMDLSPDGKVVATWELGDTVRVFDVTTAKELYSLPAYRHAGARFALSNRSLAVSSTSQLLDVATGKKRAELGSTFTFSRDGKVLATATRTLRLLNAETGMSQGQFGPKDDDTTPAIVALALNGNGKRIASATDDGAIRFWDADSGQEFHPPGNRPEWFTEAFLSPDGQALALAVRDGNVQVWDCTKGTLRVLTGPMSLGAFSPDGQTLATTGTDGKIKLWDVRSGQLLVTIPGETYTVFAGFARDGKRLVSLGKNIVKVWDTKGVLQFSCPAPEITSLAFAPDARALAWATSDGTFDLCDLGGKPRSVPGLRGCIPFAFTPDGTLLARRPDAVVSWDAVANKERATLKTLSSLWALAPDGRNLATGEGTKLRVWDVANGQLKTSLEGHTDDVRALAFAPDGRRLASVGRDGRVIVWEPELPQRKVREWQLPGPVLRVAFAPDGRHLAVVNGNGTVYILRLGAATGHR